LVGELEGFRKEAVVALLGYFPTSAGGSEENHGIAAPRMCDRRVNLLGRRVATCHDAAKGPRHRETDATRWGAAQHSRPPTSPDGLY
jgi:hypothetical protein